MGTETYLTSPVPRAPSAESGHTQQEVDLPLLLTMVVLVIFGLTMLFSASWDFSLTVNNSPTRIFTRQMMWVGIGGLAAFGLSRFDYHYWRRLAVPVIVVTIVSLVSVLLISEVRLGATRALYRGSIQPSELAKLVTVVYLSVWLYAKREQLQNIQFGMIPLGIILGIIGGLIYIQPDLSAAGTIIILGGMLFFLAGGDLRQIVFLLIAAVIGVWVVVQLSPTGQERIAAYWAGIQDPTQSSYHVRRSLEAVVSGGVFGVGLGKASTKLIGLPVPPTDSIFAVVVEELGLFGGLLLIGLYGVLVWRGIVIARRAPDMLGSLLATGVAFWIGIEAVINMAVMVGLFPFAGNALPFVSAGGSNMVASLAAIGILMNVSRQAGQPNLDEEHEDRRSYGAVVDLRGRNGRRRVSRTRRPAGIRR